MKLKKNQINGFTLVELLAVIAVLGLLLVIAVPKVLDTLNNSKKRIMGLTAMVIAKSVEEKKLENETFGIDEEITCQSVVDINDVEYSSCNIKFDEEGKAYVTIVGSGKFNGLYICNGTKTDAKTQVDKCDLQEGETGGLGGETTPVNPVSHKLGILNTMDMKKNYSHASTWTLSTKYNISKFDGRDIWTNGSNIYYSSGASQYVLNGNTWETKTWNGITGFHASNIWTDGTNIYYSQNDNNQYVLNAYFRTLFYLT